SQHRLVFYTRIQHEEPLGESRHLYDPLGRRTGKRVWRRERDLTGWMSLSRKPEVTWYGWDGDRLTTVQTDTKRIQTVYQPGSFTPLIRIETENGELQKAQRRSLAEKLQQEGSEDGHGVLFPAELVRMLDRLEGEIRADRVSSESRQWLAQCGLTVERLAAQIEPVYLPERKIHLYHCDHRGLPLALISTEGATEWRGEYDEWGNQLNEENPHHLFQPYRLPGQQYDDESGLCYNRYRYYEPLQGRYITQDPIGLNGGWNLYKYPLNPINYADPLGLAVDINHFPVNEDIRNYAEKVWNNPNIITIGTHGDPQSVYDENYNKIDVKTLANEVRNHPKFKPGMSVRLLSCNTGKGNNSYAQQLADELGVRVYAPDQYDWYYSNGKVEPWGGFYDANNQLQMDTNQPGHEFTFKRRKP
ncbi:RHS repeat protein, partial [Escherichia coli]|uniref:RHS repeat domain-containing protein n=1 Tax=Escherichia coli TaxID=562 RepID=UPI0010ACD3CB